MGAGGWRSCGRRPVPTHRRALAPVPHAACLTDRPPPPCPAASPAQCERLRELWDDLMARTDRFERIAEGMGEGFTAKKASTRRRPACPACCVSCRGLPPDRALTRTPTRPALAPTHPPGWPQVKSYLRQLGLLPKIGRRK